MKYTLAATALVGVALVLAGHPEGTAPTQIALSDVLQQHALLAAPAASGSEFGEGLAELDGLDLDDLSDEELTMIVGRYCRRCHNDRQLTGNLTLEGFDFAQIQNDPELGEKMILKLRANMMPPPGQRRPGTDTLVTLVETLEDRLDEAASDNPNPGTRPFQRLNRPEYEQAIRDLLALDVDASNWLPLDQMSANFDNIADVQAMSATLLDSYLNAASEISRMAVGDRQAPAVQKVYSNSEYVSQHAWDRVEGAPYGTRGGMVVEHVFPVDGEYIFDLVFQGGTDTRLEDVDLSINGDRVSLIHYTELGVGADGRGSEAVSTEPIFVRAGQHRVSAAFVRRFDGPYEDLIRPHDWSLAGGGSGGGGITVLPHLKDLAIGGPYNATTVSQTASRSKIFTCRPRSDAEERPCAEEIVKRLATDAYRRVVEDREVQTLMSFYDDGAMEGGFEIGVRTALEAILASPYFVFRLEPQPEGVRAGETYEIEDVALASRLSFFLWGTPPDEELLAVAEEGDLTDEDELERQTIRMLSDPRAEALGSRFAGQWLRLQDLYKVRPDPNFYPNFDENLADLMARETELFFYNLVKENQSALELYRADYSYVNDRLARHYGIPNVSGSHFRKVTYPDDTRQGLLGHGSVLVLTSLANRTSPVLRGKWVMEVLLGTPPPPPPPGVPALEETEVNEGVRILTTRERMEKHRENPVCNSCHQYMDPIGLALDNFDVTAKWRQRENGAALDTRGELYDGTPITTPGELVAALLQRPTPMLRAFTENLLAYALGRRVEYYDQPTVRAIVREAEEDDFAMHSFFLGVVKSDAFRMKQAQAVNTDQLSSH